MTFMRSPGELAGGDHACLVYDDERRRDEAMRSFLLAGLERGERVVYVPERDPDGIAAELEPTARPEQLTIMAAHETYVADGAFAPQRALETLRSAAEASRAAGFPALRAAGGPPATVTANGQSHALPDYERSVDEIVAAHGIAAVCAYDTRTTDPRALLGVVAAHPIVLYAVQPDPRLHAESPERQRLVLRGTLESATIGSVVPALADALAAGEDVELDLRAVDFVDLSGVRLLVEAAGLLDRGGRHLVVTATPAWLPQILDMVGFDDRKGLVLQ
jgi:anti-anti-sigma regulatory factor